MAVTKALGGAFGANRPLKSQIRAPADAADPRQAAAGAKFVNDDETPGDVNLMSVAATCC
jgi:hypothetical protein